MAFAWATGPGQMFLDRAQPAQPCPAAPFSTCSQLSLSPCPQGLASLTPTHSHMQVFGERLFKILQASTHGIIFKKQKQKNFVLYLWVRCVFIYTFKKIWGAI